LTKSPTLADNQRPFRALESSRPRRQTLFRLFPASIQFVRRLSPQRKDNLISLSLSLFFSFFTLSATVQTRPHFEHCLSSPLSLSLSLSLHPSTEPSRERERECLCGGSGRPQLVHDKPLETRLRQFNRLNSLLLSHFLFVSLVHFRFLYFVSLSLSLSRSLSLLLVFAPRPCFTCWIRHSAALLFPHHPSCFSAVQCRPFGSRAMDEQRTKRVPKCGFCQNHGIKNALRGKSRSLLLLLLFLLLFVSFLLTIRASQ
jgi:hypothetical protein